MTNRILIAVLIMVVLACNKKNADTPEIPQVTDTTINDSTDTTQHSDSTVKVVVGTVDSIGLYDSISIPITINQGAGTAQDITLAVTTHIPPRTRVVLSNTSGTTPMTTTLTVYFYFFDIYHYYGYLTNTVGNGAYMPITVTATADNGDKITANIRLRQSRSSAGYLEVLYTLYQRSPNLNTYYDGKLIHTGTKMGLNGTNQVLTNLVSEINPVTSNMFYSIDTPGSALLPIRTGTIIYGHFNLDHTHITATDGVETRSYRTYGYGGYYDTTDVNHYWFTIFSNVSGKDQIFNIEGEYKF